MRRTVIILDRLAWLAVNLAIFAAILGVTGLIALQVGSRIAGGSVPWTEELSRVLFFWAVWLGMAASFRGGLHPSMGVLTVMAGPRLARALRFLPPLCAALFFAVVARHGWALMMQQIRFGEISAILQVGMWVTTLPLVLGAGLAVLGALAHAVADYPEPESRT